ncbi:MAG TPA: radical SAM protein [Bdellovibrionota bacterium]|nr:radical SAM protein [Bdellovibrionota bacterium]
MNARYLELHLAGKLRAKVDQALSLLNGTCRVCPHYCKVDRMKQEKAICRSGRWAAVNSYGPSFDAEDRVRGWKGSGAIVFSECNLKCMTCQKRGSGLLGNGKETKADELAGMMLALQERGCHNVSFVNPSHVVPQIVEALAVAAEKALRVPIVYQTCAFDSEESLAVLDGLVDVYVPEFRFWDDPVARKYTSILNYGEITRRAVQEMYRQVGDLQFDANGLVTRGLLVRHMVMPKDLSGTRDVMRFLAKQLSPNTYVNMMANYEPSCEAMRDIDVARAVTYEEYKQAVDSAVQEGIHRVDAREAWF